MAKKAGLGRGLDALFADLAPVEESSSSRAEEGAKAAKASGAAETEDRVLYVEINDIRPNSAQPRKNFDEVKLGELASSEHQRLRACCRRKKMARGKDVGSQNGAVHR